MTPSAHQFKTLVDHHHGYVGFCQCCQTVNICYKNSLFCLELSAYQLFSEMIQERVGMYEFHTSHGKEVMMKTPLNNYFILFKERELDEFSDMLKQACLLIETFKGVRNRN